jgi:hypothetical protein
MEQHEVNIVKPGFSKASIDLFFGSVKVLDVRRICSRRIDERRMALLQLASLAHSAAESSC